MTRKVLVAMSGGVDSSVAAALLCRQGCDVSGATLKLFGNADIRPEDGEKACGSLSDVDDARNVANRLGIAHYVFNLNDRFKESVIDHFTACYLNGLTPNPCIVCNKYIKFGEFLNRAELLGYDLIATGHYAVSEYDASSGRWLLKRAADRKKDQTYVLYGMTQRQLEHTVFPLGALRKDEVRNLAEGLGFFNRNKPDSQDICFVEDGDYAGFIERYSEKAPEAGNFIDRDGNVIGTHKGLIHYTVGQRKGLGSGFGQRMYVVKKDREANTVTLGSNEQLYSKSLVAEAVNLIAVDKLESSVKVRAKIRYSQSEENATLCPMNEGRVLVEFSSPQRAVTPGQAVVFYDGDVVIGGGTITA